MKHLYQVEQCTFTKNIGRFNKMLKWYIVAASQLFPSGEKFLDSMEFTNINAYILLYIVAVRVKSLIPTVIMIFLLTPLLMKR